MIYIMNAAIIIMIAFPSYSGANAGTESKNSQILFHSYLSREVVASEFSVLPRKLWGML